MVKILRRRSILFRIFRQNIDKKSNFIKTINIRAVVQADRWNFSMPTKQDQNQLSMLRSTRNRQDFRALLSLESWFCFFSIGIEKVYRSASPLLPPPLEHQPKI